MTYLGWALFVFAVGMQFWYWPLAMTVVNARRRMGMTEGPLGVAVLFSGIAALALFAWPFLAATFLHRYEEPSIFGLMVMTIGAVALGAVEGFGCAVISRQFMHAGSEEFGVAEQRLRLVENVAAYAPSVSAIMAMISLTWGYA